MDMSIMRILRALHIHFHSEVVWSRHDGLTLMQLLRCRCGHEKIETRELDATAW